VKNSCFYVCCNQEDLFLSASIAVPLRKLYSMKRLRLLTILLLPTSIFAQAPDISLVQNQVIRQSCHVKPGQYHLQAGSEIYTEPVDMAALHAVIVIEGNGITVDFQSAELSSTTDITRPDQFTGLAILIKGKHITLKNAVVRGFKIALLAQDADSLHLENCDFSYNYRPQLRSIREREDFSDWLSYHHNEHDEWLRYGAAFYLKNCQAATVKGCRATGCQNALLMNGCDDGLVYNNFFHFNSGLGIGLYRSSRNKLMHNFLDWNVRGFSHRFYERGQDSAGILLYEQCNNNLIAFNSVTHSGDGLFLWAGQSTMDHGQGGCNDNLIYGNDFSNAPTNGIEATFSRNTIQGNLIRGCTYGIWAGYSYESLLMGNLIAGCKTGIAIENGQQNTISRNLFMGDTTGINIWARETQPPDWGYAQQRDVSSRHDTIDRNVFLGVRKPLKISNAHHISVNGENLFEGFETLLETPKPNEGLKFLRNDVYGTRTELERVWSNPALAASKNVNFSHTEKPENPYTPLDIRLAELHEPDSLPDGMLAVLPETFPQGRRFIMVDAWGPFDFRRPIATLDTLAGNLYGLVLIGPAGDWKVTGMKGVKKISAQKGRVPTSLTVERDPAADGVEINFDCVGSQPITTVFGQKIDAGKPYSFNFKRFDKKIRWQIKYYNYAEKIPTINFRQQKPAAEQSVEELYFAWWGKPIEGVQEDFFATVSTTTVDVAPGEYVLELTSDDGARLYVDGKLMMDHWDVHEPVTDTVTVSLGGRHSLLIEHFEATGFATLGFRLQPK
jgi:parallel beta-helix repeat protein